MSKSRETVTEKRTVYTSSSSSGGTGNTFEDVGDLKSSFKSSISPRNTVLSRSSTGPFRSSMGEGGTVITRTVEYGYGKNYGNLGPGGYEKTANTGVQNVKHNREKEKKDMQDLNERFASYIEKVRFLEAQNRKLGNELETLKSRWGKETSAIKDMFEAELASARKLIDDLTREKADLEIKNSSLKDQMNEMQRLLDDAKRLHQQDREIIEKNNQQLSDYEAEINMLRRTIDSLEKNRLRDRERVERLQSEVDKLRIDLNNETLNHLDAENRRQTLEEEMEFLKRVHEQELKELAALAYRDTTEENREFWKNELGQAIRDIQKEYDSKVDQLRGDMEAYYNLKVQEFRTGATKQNMEVTHIREENKKMIKQMTDLKGRLADLEARNAQLEKQYQDLLKEFEQLESDHALETSQYKEEITKMRAEMESILQELQTLMDAKLSLELEILAYRKLLEGEESRIGLKNVVDEAVNAQSRGASQLTEMISGYESKGDSSMSMKVMRGEVSAKTTYQRTSTGPVSISEVSPEGKFIVLENTSSGANRRDVDLNKWVLRRKVDGLREHTYEFRNFTLKPGKSVRIFARSAASEAGLNDLVNRDEDTWGVGSEVQTILQNDKIEDKATHTQKTLYNN